jgi:antitoxin PrlF
MRRYDMRVTTKGQVTIPKNVRESLGIVPETDVDFQEDNGRFYIVKISKNKPTTRFNKLRGIATTKMSTDEIMDLTRKNKGIKNSTLPDFFIGAHAAVSSFDLITRDTGRYKTYFPNVNIISPKL